MTALSYPLSDFIDLLTAAGFVDQTGWLSALAAPAGAINATPYPNPVLPMLRRAFSNIMAARLTDYADKAFEEDHCPFSGTLQVAPDLSTIWLTFPNHAEAVRFKLRWSY